MTEMYMKRIKFQYIKSKVALKGHLSVKNSKEFRKMISNKWYSDFKTKVMAVNATISLEFIRMFRGRG